VDARDPEDGFSEVFDGVAVAMIAEDVRYAWIFSSHTLRYLGERDIYVAKPRDLHITPGSIAAESAVLQRAFVNHPGQTPGCPADQ
jgi:hypothetical protein